LLAGTITLGAFGTSLAVQLLWMLYDQRHGAPSTSPLVETPLTLARGALAVQLALAVLTAVTLRRHRELRRRALDFKPVPVAVILASLGLALGLAPIANDLGFRISEALRAAPDNARWVTEVIQRANRGEFLLLAFSLTLLPACVEELLFRGLLVGTLLGAPRGLNILVQALVFGAFHVDLAQSIATFVLGLGFGFMRLTTRSLLTSMVAHATYNLIVLFAMRWTNTGSEPTSHQTLAISLAGLALSISCGVLLERHFRRHFGARGLS
jgi:membrane protease YdiL (CAAX protease family)